MPATHQTFPNDETLAAAVAAGMRQIITTAAAENRMLAVALSGGRISKRVFAALATTPDAIHWSTAARFFWADERCVPPDHPDSNYLAAGRDLLEPLRIPAAHAHRIPGELPPDLAAALAAAELRNATGTQSNTMPVLDLILLGMGEDGHVASLFPGHDPELTDERSPYLPIYNSPKLPPERVSLGMGALIAAHEVWVLVAGAGKEHALRESLAPGGTTPLARLLQRRTQPTRILSSIGAAC